MVGKLIRGIASDEGGHDGTLKGRLTNLGGSPTVFAKNGAPLTYRQLRLRDLPLLRNNRQPHFLNLLAMMKPRSHNRLLR